MRVQERDLLVRHDSLGHVAAQPEDLRANHPVGLPYRSPCVPGSFSPRSPRITRACSRVGTLTTVTVWHVTVPTATDVARRRRLRGGGRARSRAASTSGDLPRSVS